MPPCPCPNWSDHSPAMLPSAFSTARSEKFASVCAAKSTSAPPTDTRCTTPPALDVLAVMLPWDERLVRASRGALGSLQATAKARAERANHAVFMTVSCEVEGRLL